MVAFGEEDFGRANETCRIHNNLTARDPNAEGDCDWIRFLIQWKDPEGRVQLEEKASDLREENDLSEDSLLHEALGLPPYELANNPARLFWPENFIELFVAYRESVGWTDPEETEEED
ncbi:MAG: hypothetical protein KDD64_12360, partial [Bdellovibrionales bacterium]|nr:hypothetical protein [Bdellovibrionales bacterium]